ncbi:TetR/AcrR family transcriptional regulator [Georgenia thermotolerans]|uniref:HTH tetR-type domain-containing protein n=1 Tax=Georgenia thermotolerans TaxID=527326 RepID=A0A7J5URJ0_9MICO|nr:TetR/AcrR family transcriptional regulator [Georgenia thermotolerans]KAE8764831.1 hypothetical protein GB883_06810 [Georgenia thermotolerans]
MSTTGGTSTAGRASDPRARRTVAALQQALLTLCATTSPSEIDVSKLCRAAGVHRTTFYKHFTAVSEVAETIVADLLERIDSTPLDPEHGYRAWLDELLAQVARRRGTYSHFLGSDGDPAVVRNVCDRLVRRTAEVVPPSEDPGSADVLVHTLAFASYGLIEAVIANEDLDVAASVDAFVGGLPTTLRQQSAAA